MSLISEEQYKVIIDGAQGQALDGIWAYFEIQGPPFGDRAPIEVWGFEKCKEAFFEILCRLLLEKRIRLAKNGVFLDGAQDDIVALFKSRFPSSLAIASETGGVGAWFFTDGCPAGAVWVTEREGGGEFLEWT